MCTFAMYTFMYITFFAIFTTTVVSEVRYNGYRIYKVSPVNEDQFKVVEALSTNQNYSFLGVMLKPPAYADILVPPTLRKDFLNSMAGVGTKIKLLVKDVQKIINKDKRMLNIKTRFGWKKYNTLEEIEDWMIHLETKYPDKVNLVKAGETYEGRNILAIHISHSAQNENRSMFIEGGIHAREWISPAVITYFINELLTSRDQRIRKLAESYDWYIMPVYNADGYVYSFTDDRLWRKNRNPIKGSNCVGIDLNRNFDAYWVNDGINGNPCLPNYSGDKPFSEIETKSLAKYIDSINEKLIGYMTIHSYGQHLLIPNAYGTLVDNFDDLYKIGVKTVKSLKKKFNTEYTVGNFGDVMYTANGVSLDWVKATYDNIKLIYSYELRDTGANGFILPPSSIIPTAQETIDSFVTMFEEYGKLNL